ncbi:hypothetical protein TNCV_1739021 [Trichonephila clavipes]|nr:hypothetical protein TNCV_1739021 [Trichonephila clavipes]
MGVFELGKHGGIIREQASTDGPVFMCFDFFPDLSNESVNFAFVWLISGVVPEFSESIFCSDKLVCFQEGGGEVVNYPSGRGSRDRIRNYEG